MKKAFQSSLELSPECNGPEATSLWEEANDDKLLNLAVRQAERDE